MNNEMNDEFARQSRETLRESEQQLDTATRAKLAAARRDALEENSRAPANWRFGRGAPVWGTLAAAVLIAVIVLRTTDPLPDQPNTMIAEANPETETVSIEEELDLYENPELLEFYEDLEFYEWLADEAPEEIAS